TSRPTQVTVWWLRTDGHAAESFRGPRYGPFAELNASYTASIAKGVSMKTGCFASMAAIASVAAVVSLAPVSVAGQTPAAAARTWNPPRTPDGQPDIQGYWIPQGPTPAMTFPTYTLEGGHPFDEEQTVIAGANAAGANAQQWSRALKAQSVVID